MIAICEECGAKYRIDASRFDKDTVRVRCNACGSVIEMSKSRSLTSGYQASSNQEDGLEDAGSASQAGATTRGRGLGSREKRLAFLLLPLVIVVGAGIFYLIS